MPVPKISESKLMLQGDIQFQTKIMVKQTSQDPNNIFISEINTYIINLWLYSFKHTLGYI